MNINLISVEENPHWVVPKDGIYLVRVTRKLRNSPHTINKYFDTDVTRKFDTSKNIWHNSFGCFGTVTHISSQQVK
jgi:hypothetical protein